MTITFQLPETVEQRLRKEFSDIEQAAKEAALVELYRQNKITFFELGQALGLAGCETNDLLRRHGVTEDLLNWDEHEAQLAGLRKLLT